MAQCRKYRHRLLVLISSLAIPGLNFLFPMGRALTQIVPDRTLGAESSIVTPRSGSVDTISGGATRGGNLFHSFSQFSVLTGRTAYFNNAGSIQNTISRVTGGTASNINGLIKANGTANLFLINPNGIVFGPNALLNIGGSFVASTASSLKFADGTEFSATNPQTSPLLTVSVPIGLQFGGNQGSILNQSQATDSNGNTVGLQVQPGTTLALEGGNITVDGGYLTAPSGRVELGSVAGNSLVGLTPTLTGYHLGYENVEGFQDISFQHGASVTTINSNRDGGIHVQGANVTLTDGSSIQASLLGSGTGDGLNVDATKSVQLSGTDSSLSTKTESNPTTTASDLTITTPMLSVQNGARVLSDTLGSGKGGNVNINASNQVQLSGTGSSLLTQTENSATAAAGDLTITTPILSVQNGARVLSDTLGSGNGGNVNINASNQVQLVGRSADGQFASGVFAQTEKDTTGNAGDLTITTPMLSVQNGAQVLSDTLGSGNGGNVNINASNQVQLVGRSANGQFASGVFAQTESNATGNAGDLTITTPSLEIENGAQISAGTLGAGNGGNVNINATKSVQLSGTGSSLLIQAESNPAAAGDLTITTPMLSVQNGARVLSDTLGSGKGGNVNINASNQVQLSGTGSSLLTQTENSATAAAGDLTITTPTLSVQNGAQVLSDTLGSGNGGNVNINASNQVQLVGRSANSQFASGVFAQTESNATGNAGNLTITTPLLQIENGAQVSAGTSGAGKGGSVNINTSNQVQLIGRSANGQFASGVFAQTESNATGNAGDLTITTPLLQVDNGAQISAGTLGAGKGGNVNINASNQVQLVGRSTDGQFASGVFAQTEKNTTGNAGDLTITTPSLQIENGAQISAGTLGAGNGGNVNINASNQVQLVGRSADGQFASGVFAQTESNATGNAGNLTITTPNKLLVQDGAVVSVLSLGKGNAGSLQIQAGTVTLNGGSSISATTSSTEGGNINLMAQDLLLLRRNSNISTTAGNEQAGGNGGNIKITTPFVLAVPQENSDISANAFKGNGGSVTIAASGGIFGTQSRKLPTSESDITASSTGGGINGVVNINTPIINPSYGVAKLPAIPINVNTLIANTCIAGRHRQGGSFIVTGSGGLPTRPGDALVSPYPTGSIRSLPGNGTAINNSPEATTAAMPPSTSTTAAEEIVPATGWVFNHKGQVMLTAQAPGDNNFYIPWLPPTTCHAD